MSLNFSAWLLDTEALPETERAALAWRRINDKPSSVAFRTPAGATLAAQTVRLEFSGVSERTSDAGPGAVRTVTVFGVRNHATVADTIIGKGYRFVSGPDEYVVVDVIQTLGEVQARAEAVS